MSLKDELDAFRSEFMTKVSPEIRQAMTRADTELAAAGITKHALKAGDPAPDFRLPDARGCQVRFRDLLAKGPVVVSFYRGGWCPYCNLELRALQNALPEIKQLGAQLVAISPQTPDLTEELRPIYSRLGHALPDKNGDDSWILPIPATYVIDKDGIVALAFVDVDYRNRLEPAEIVATLKTLSEKASHETVATD